MCIYVRQHWCPKIIPRNIVRQKRLQQKLNSVSFYFNKLYPNNVVVLIPIVAVDIFHMLNNFLTVRIYNQSSAVTKFQNVRKFRNNHDVSRGKNKFF